ncbi:hypothetical protein vseg_006659 [Gypsophila vaccaria]
MSFPCALRCNSSPVVHRTTSSFPRSPPSVSSSSSSLKFRCCRRLQLLVVSRLGRSREVDVVCRVSDADDTQPADNVEEKDEHVSTENTNLTDSNTPNNSEVAQEKEQVSTEVLSSDGSSVGDNEMKINGEGGVQDEESLKVTTGSPLPGLKPRQLDEADRIPKETIDILRDQVFGFDTFFVTGQEPYEGGVLFKGNLRGVPSKSYEKVSKRLQDKFGDQFKLFLLINPEDEKPVAVVVPKKILQPETSPVPEWFAAGAFGLVTVFTLLLRNVPALQSDLLSSFDKLDLLKDGLPGALVTALILGVHELGHYVVSKDCGVQLGVPFFVPSWQIGSFGAITRIVNIVPKREDLLKIAAAGPLAGFTLGLLLFLLGFILPPSDGLGVIVDASVFHESLLAGGIAKLLLGDVLREGQSISVNPLVIWAWAGLLINALNSIPAGELDGGRISFAIWGRKVSTRWTGASIVLLGLSSLFSDVAFYWVALIFFLQRSPIAPLSEEVSEPDQKYIALGVTVLLLGLLVCLPYPFPFSYEAMTTFLES